MSATPDPARLLIVEDDDQLATLLLEYLGQHGFQLTRAADGLEGTQLILHQRPDLVILDLMLPGTSGLDVLRQVRGEFLGAILMLTASQSEADHVAGLELGADDFVTKPIEPRVLLARINTQLRKLQRPSASPLPQGLISVGALTMDVPRREVRAHGAPVPLTSMEFDVLLRLATDAGHVVDRDTLYAEVMGVAYDGLDRGMDVHVSRVRRKLACAGLDATCVKAVRGLGYLLAVR